MPAKRKLLVTQALPYANGAPHLGHMVGYDSSRYLGTTAKNAGS